MDEKQFRVIIGEMIKVRRLQKRMSKKELGLELGYAPNSAGQVISKIESGKIAIPQKKIANIIRILDITHEELGISDISIPIETVLTSSRVITTIYAGVGTAIGAAAGTVTGSLIGGLARFFDIVEDIGDGVTESTRDVFEKINELCKGDEKKRQAILKILNS